MAEWLSIGYSELRTNQARATTDCDTPVTGTHNTRLTGSRLTGRRTEIVIVRHTHNRKQQTTSCEFVYYTGSRCCWYRQCYMIHRSE